MTLVRFQLGDRRVQLSASLLKGVSQLWIQSM
jgi:hypothetical protein